MLSCTLSVVQQGVAISCAGKRGHDGSKHHPFDQTKFSDISTVFKSIQKKKRQLRKGWKARMGTSSPVLPVRGRRTLSFGGGGGGHLCPGQHIGFDGVGRRRIVINVITSRLGCY